MEGVPLIARETGGAWYQADENFIGRSTAGDGGRCHNTALVRGFTKETEVSSFSKFVLTALVALGGVAANAHEAAPRAVFPVVSAHASTPTLSTVRYVGHRHHHRHRAHPVRHVR